MQIEFPFNDKRLLVHYMLTTCQEMEGMFEMARLMYKNGKVYRIDIAYDEELNENILFMNIPDDHFINNIKWQPRAIHHEDERKIEMRVNLNHFLDKQIVGTINRLRLLEKLRILWK